VPGPAGGVYIVPPDSLAGFWGWAERRKMEGRKRGEVKKRKEGERRDFGTLQ